MQTNPMLGLWLARERVKQLQVEAGADLRRARPDLPARQRRRRGALRLALGARLVSMGSRLLGDAAEVVTLHAER